MKASLVEPTRKLFGKWNLCFRSEFSEKVLAVCKRYKRFTEDSDSVRYKIFNKLIFHKERERDSVFF